MIIKVDSWNILGADAARIRQEVFCVEQGIAPEEEWDEWDALSLQAVAYDAAGHAIATGRLLPPENGLAKIGRMAVLNPFRNQGWGGQLLTALIASADSDKVSHFGNPPPVLTQLQLHAQVPVIGFYSRFGFLTMGAEFLEVGIPHILMRLALPNVPNFGRNEPKSNENT